ncbi:hybrid sensor histidine kinase/response regulator [Zavarzinella formosa]|uniref:hybrid sensor histidine kinase/response regulator n=1 Tax=Zavarzinella formosa TaxID=360055 RepID=UPI00030C054C|nr:hybrid sensor histidine kinase/response regulator [Zavarzinella formosa]
MNDEAEDSSLFDVFREEVRQGLAAIAASLPDLNSPEAGPAWTTVLEAARAIRGAARIVGVDAAATLAAGIEECGSKLLNQSTGWNDRVRDSLRQTTDILGGLVDLKEAQVADWGARQESAIVAALAGLRPEPALAKASPPAPVEPVPVLAEPSPVSFSAMPFSLFDLFRDEVRSHANALSNGILELENDVANPQRIEPLMRAAHSIKGSARIVSIDLAVELAHVMEDVFVAAQKGKILLRPADIDVFLAATDVFASLAEITESGIAGWTAARQASVKPLKETLAAILKGESPVAVATKPATTATVPVTPPPAVVPVAVGKPPEPVAADRPTDEPVVRVTAARLNRLMGLAGESLVQARWLQPFAASLIRLKKQQDILGETIDVLAERISVGDRPDTLTRLIEEARKQLGECHQTVSGRIGEFEDRAASADDLNSRLYREVIASRMRPFADGTQSFPRLVRDMARTLGKQVRLDILGQSTDVDRDILEKLESPLNHMIRNSVDHGMETPEERRAAGKPEGGVIRLEARHRSGTLAITVTDDGRGIDPERVRRKIVDRGMVPPEMAGSLSEAELLEFLFLPGFSTASAVSEYSGRGVGLDVVQEMIRTVGGTVRITTRFGQGTTFHLQLPITLSVVRAVLVVIGGDSYAFPHNRIDRLLRIPVSDVRSLENRQYVAIDGHNIGLVLAAQILDLGNQSRSNETLSVILLSDSTGQYGLIVDSFTGEQDLVVRPLDPRLGKVPNIAAAAILDDGLPVLIADVEDMIRSMDSFIQTGNVLRLSRRDTAAGAGPSRGNVLVVDDSATVREVEKQLLRQMGLQVTLANDGQDGWNKLRTGDYDLVVTDIDMPRMTGLELLRLIRTDSQFRNIPVIVVSYKDRDEDRQRGIDLGANFYLMKSSFHDNTFVRAVQSLLVRQ